MGNVTAKDVHAAVDKSDVSKLEKILEAKPELIDELSADGETPIFHACAVGNLDVAELLLEFEADVSIPCKPMQNMTCLHLAAMDIEPELVSLLLEGGADANAKTVEGVTPLHCAVQYGSFEISKLLLEAGADPTATTVDGTTPFEVTPNGDENIVPLTGEQIAELFTYAKKAFTSSGGAAMIKTNKKFNHENDGDDDFNEMLRFFRDAGLGCAEAKSCAVYSVKRGAKTAKKLAVLIKSQRFTLRELLESAGSGVIPLDDVDYELVVVALSRVIQNLYAQSNEDVSSSLFTLESVVKETENVTGQDE